MIMNGTMRHIRVEQVKALTDHPAEVKCPDYRIEGEFPPYNRLADFFWQIISEKILPALSSLELVESKERAGDMAPTMLPANLIRLSKDENGDVQYLLVCADERLTTTYHIWFTLDDEIFRRSQYGFHVEDVVARVTDHGNVREFKPDGVSEQGYNAYWELAQALWLVVEDCVSMEFMGTDDEDDADYYFTPRWVDLRKVTVHLEQDHGKCRLTGSLADGSYRAEATFTLQEKLK